MERVKGSLQRIFGIYAGEGAHALRFARLAIFWAFGSSCLDILSDGFFLEKIGADALPTTYLLIALGMIAVSSLVLRCLKTEGPYRILTIAMALGVLFCFSAAFLVEATPSPLFWYALKIGSKIFFTVMIASSWTFIDQYHDLQDAKRVYALYNSAYFFGTILSGTAITLLLDRIGCSGLLFAAAAFILLALREARGIALKAKAIHDDSVEGIFSGNRDSFSSVIQLISRSSFTIVLLLLSFFIQLLLTTTEFNYMEAFDRAFGSDAGEGKIAEFLGKCRAAISLCNIFIGVFCYSRFVRRTGVHNAILITPLFFFAVYSGWLLHNGIAFAILGLVAVDGILFTVEDNGFNLLSNAVPTHLKSKVRIINDSFFEPLGMLFSSLLLFTMQSKSLWLGFSLSLFVLILTLAVRSTYPKALFLNLKDNALHFERKLKEWLCLGTRREQREAKKEVLQALLCEKKHLLAAESLLELGDPAFLPEILSAANGVGTAAKIELLRLLDQSPFRKDPQVIEAIVNWSQQSSSLEFLKRAHLYLAKMGLFSPNKQFDPFDSNDPLLRAAAILNLKKSPLHRTLAEQQLHQMLQSPRIDELSIAIDLLVEENRPEVAEQIFPHLFSESILIQRTAGRSIARIADATLAHLTPRLIEALKTQRDNSLRLFLLDALGKIDDVEALRDLLLASVYFRPNERRRTEEIIAHMGLKTTPLLLSFVKDISIPERARILAGKILGRLALPQLRAHLPGILDIEIERAYFYFYFGHTIQNQYPLYDLAMLQNALFTGYQSVIDFIIHLLGAAGSLEDPSLLVRALHSRNAKIHSHAIESLEKTCDAKIFPLIAPLVDDLPLEEKMKACLQWQGNFPTFTLPELLAKLERSPSLFDKIAAIRLKAKLQMPNWKQQVREQMEHANPIFHQYADELLNLS